MKAYIVYVDGHEAGIIRAGSHNSAEAKARRKWHCQHDDPAHVWVEYTEV